MCRTPAPPSTALVASSIWSGVGEVKTSPGQAASSMPRPKKPACIGSCPEPPPEMIPTLPWTGASARTTTIGSWITRTLSPCAASTPCRASRTTASGSLISFFMPSSFGCRAPQPGNLQPRLRAGQSGSVSWEDALDVVHAVVLVRPEHLVDEEHVVGGRRFGLGLGHALALPEGANLVHRLAALGGIGDRDGLAEAHLELVAAREQLALGPVLAGRHRVVGAADVDRDDGDPVLGGEHGGARADLADRAVARARALGVHQQVPAVLDQAVDVIGRAVAEPAAVAAERHGVEQQGDAVGLPARLVEVVGGGGDGGAAAPVDRDRAQDRRRVEVARVIGHEDHRPVLVELLAVEDLATVDLEVRVVLHQRPQAEAEEHLAKAAGHPAASPRDIHLRVLARELGALAAELGALGAQLAAELVREPVLQIRNPFPELRNAFLEVCAQRLEFARARPARSIDAALTHANLYSGGRGRFLRPVTCRACGGSLPSRRPRACSPRSPARRRANLPGCALPERTRSRSPATGSCTPRRCG